MSDPKPAEPGKKTGILKTVIGAVAGLMSGAVMMYLSPLLDKVVKPAKPVANFAVDHQGTTVIFHNRSAGGGEGWWDFGDGSPLEPVTAGQETITHTYADPGEYIAKLSLRNLIGEESERTVSLQLENSKGDQPVIENLEAIPISPGAYAPATFRVTSRSKNAKLCVWNFDDSPFQISTDSPNHQDRLVTFKEPGSYVVKIAAVNGNKAAEKSTVVMVDVPPAGTLTAIVSVADSGTRVDTLDTVVPITAAFPPQSKDASYSFERQVPARQGYEIVSARLESASDKNVRGLNLQVDGDKRAAKLSGELVRGGGKKTPPPTLVVRVLLKQEKRVADSRQAVPVTSTLSVPGSTLMVLPQLPAHWVDAQRQLKLELRDGDRVVRPESQLPRGASVTVQNRRCTLTATPLGSQVRVELLEAKPDVKPAAN